MFELTKDEAINLRSQFATSNKDGERVVITNLKENQFTVMEATNVLRIPNPSKELLAFIENTEQVKIERLEEMRQRFISQQCSGL